MSLRSLVCLLVESSSITRDTKAVTIMKPGVYVHVYCKTVKGTAKKKIKNIYHYK